jgi:hypothetical protein
VRQRHRLFTVPFSGDGARLNLQSESDMTRQHCRLSILMILLSALFASTLFAAKMPWNAATQADITGLWRQAGVVVLDSGEVDPSDDWFTAKQFFRFQRDGTVKHQLITPDANPELITQTDFQKQMMSNTKAIQSMKWRSPGIAFLKHPERPWVRMDMGIYQQDADSGPRGSHLKPKKGDLIVVFYDYKDVNKARYYRLLRRISEE